MVRVSRWRNLIDTALIGLFNLLNMYVYFDSRYRGRSTGSWSQDGLTTSILICFWGTVM